MRPWLYWLASFLMVIAVLMISVAAQEILEWWRGDSD